MGIKRSGNLTKATNLPKVTTRLPLKIRPSFYDLFIIYIIACIFICAMGCMYVYIGGHFGGVVLSFQHVCPGDWTHVPRTGDRLLPMLRHLTGLCTNSFMSGNLLIVSYELTHMSQTYCYSPQWSELSQWNCVWGSSEVVYWPGTHVAHFLCPQESVFVLVKALPAVNCSFSSQPSSRTSQCPALCLLRTLISLPRRVALPKHLQHTRSASYLANWAKANKYLICWE